MTDEYNMYTHMNITQLLKTLHYQRTHIDRFWWQYFNVWEFRKAMYGF